MLYAIHWPANRDHETNLYASEIEELMRENDCDWTEGGRVVCNESQKCVGRIYPMESIDAMEQKPWEGR